MGILILRLRGLLLAIQRDIPAVHVEAGLRSYNRNMPEEINRIVTDKASRMLFCPTQTAIRNLYSEGITKGVFLSGDVMFDATIHFSELANCVLNEGYLESLDAQEYYLATIHRASNTSDQDKLARIIEGLK